MVTIVPGVREAASKLRSVDPALLGLGLVLEVAALFAYTLLTRAALGDEAKKISRMRLFRIQMSTKALSSIVPGGSAAGSAMGYRLMTLSACQRARCRVRACHRRPRFGSGAQPHLLDRVDGVDPDSRRQPRVRDRGDRRHRVDADRRRNRLRPDGRTGPRRAMRALGRSPVFGSTRTAPRRACATSACGSMTWPATADCSLRVARVGSRQLDPRCRSTVGVPPRVRHLDRISTR